MGKRAFQEILHKAQLKEKKAQVLVIGNYDHFHGLTLKVTRQRDRLFWKLRVASCELRVASCELRVASCELRVASCFATPVYHHREQFLA